MKRFTNKIKSNIEVFWFKTRAKLFLCRWIDTGWRALDLDTLGIVMNKEYEKCLGKNTLYAEWIIQLHEIFEQQREELED